MKYKSGITGMRAKSVQGFSESLQHCIRPQNSVTSLYGRFRDEKLPYNEVTEVSCSVARILQNPVKVIKEQRPGKGHSLFLDQSTEGTSEAQRALW